MYELIQVAENTFYMDCPAKVGFYRIGGDEVVAIDSGSDKDAGKKVRRILDAQGWKLKAIYNTHSHADHIGGNQYLQAQTGCRIFAKGVEAAMAEYPVLEPISLFAGNPMQDLRNKFLMAKESACEKLTEDVLPVGMEMIPLPGHSMDMVGFRTADDVVFLADCLSSAETLEKYRVGFLYDVRTYLETLEMVKTLKASYFVPAHAAAAEEMASLAQLNIDATLKNVDAIREIVASPKSVDDVLACVFGRFGLAMNLQQNVLVGSTVRSYLSYLKDEGLADYFFENNRMLWKKI